MRDRDRAFLTVLIVALGVGFEARGQSDLWVGTKVVTKSRTPLRVDGHIVNDGDVFQVYKVDRADRDMLYLVAGNVAGWVKASEVIPFDQALAVYTRGIRANPESVYLHVCRGMIWFEKGEKDIALSDFSEAIRIDPKCAPAYLNRGNVWFDKKDYEKAIADYNETIRLDPKSTLAFINRGNAWRARRAYDKALADYNEAVQLDPKSAEAYNGRAWVWATCPDAKLRDGKKAVESAKRACTLTGEKDVSCLDTLAAAYAEAGDYYRAVVAQDKAILLSDDEEERLQCEARRLFYHNKTPYHEPTEPRSGSPRG